VRKGGIVDEGERANNRNKSRVRARVEHAFAVVKRLWGVQQGALPWAGKELYARVCGLGAGQYLHGARISGGISSPEAGQACALDHKSDANAANYARLREKNCVS
jgi:hypothetical protein